MEMLYVRENQRAQFQRHFYYVNFVGCWLK